MAVTNADLAKMMKEMSSMMTSEIQKCTNSIKEEFKVTIAQLQRNDELLREEFTSLKAKYLALENKLEQLNKQQRIPNIIVSGIEEVENEDTLSVVGNFIVKKMKIPVKSTDIENVNRMGKKNQTDRPRPIMVRFRNVNKKVEILRNAKSLKGSNVYVNSDRTPEERQNFKLMLEKCKKAKHLGFSAHIYKNNLVINGNTITIDNLFKVDELLNKNAPSFRPSSVSSDTISQDNLPNTTLSGSNEMLFVNENQDNNIIGSSSSQRNKLRSNKRNLALNSDSSFLTQQ